MLSRFEIRERTLNYIKEHPGAKAIDLAINVLNDYDCHIDIPVLLDNLIKDKLIFEEADGLWIA